MILTKCPTDKSPHLWVLAEKKELPIVYRSVLVKLKVFGFQVWWKMNTKITVTSYVPLKFSEDVI